MVWLLHVARMSEFDNESNYIVDTEPQVHSIKVTIKLLVFPIITNQLKISTQFEVTHYCHYTICEENVCISVDSLLFQPFLPNSRTI